MKVLLTGGKGYVAAYLEEILIQKGYSVLNVSRSTDVTLQDVLDSTESFDYYIHTAGLSSDTPFSDFEDYEKANVQLSISLIERFENDVDAKCFLFFSTLYVKRKTLLTTPYVKSKTIVEEYITSRGDSRISVIRPALISSPPDARGILGPLQKLANRGVLIKFPSGFHMQWVSIETVGKQVISVLNGENANVKSGFDLIDFNAELSDPKRWLKDFGLQKSGLVIPFPKWFLKLLFSLGHALKLPFNKHFYNKLTS